MFGLADIKKTCRRIVGASDDDANVVGPRDWAQDVCKDPGEQVRDYVTGLFPIASWITRYNLHWLYGDAIAGLTVGIVGVPQSMSYAKIATLDPQYGLYSSFVGGLVYAFFATSKDVNIGPVAVMSLTVSQIIKHVTAAHPDKDWTHPQIATTIAFICGFIVLGIGLLRLGWLIEFIPAPAISGFMTGSALSIASGQVPGLLGLTGFDTRAATYEVIIQSLKHLPYTKLDAAFGLTGLVCLYIIRWSCEKLAKRYPARARIFFFCNVFRNAFIIIVLSFASWLYCRHRKDADGNYPISILKDVPRGFQDIGAPKIDPEIISSLVGELPVATIILFLEHIAIAKSFGRVNGYKINPNQELIAIGVTNTIGTVFGAYPATGSFSRSALASKSGVRSPASGLFSALVAIVALYGLTPAFYWIPNAALSAVIIHAVADLVASPRQVYSFWRVSPVEFVIWLAGLLVTIFATIEDGIYTSTAASLALLLIRVARPRGHFLGRVTLHSTKEQSSREVYIPIKPNKFLMNPHVKVYPPTPGVVVYRFEESFLYPNSSLVNDALVDYIKETTRRGIDMGEIKPSERAWNDSGKKTQSEDDQNKPILQAVVLDFSAVSHMDTTSVQALIDTRTEIERWTDRPVEFHFATILSPWIRRALIAGGFGVGKSDTHMHEEIAPVTRYHDQYIADPEHTDHSTIVEMRLPDPEAVHQVGVHVSAVSARSSTDATVSPMSALPTSESALMMLPETPFFHLDIASAVRAAEKVLERSRTPSFVESTDKKNKE